MSAADMNQHDTATELHCPQCGYDLRGQVGEQLRCPECGEAFDRATLSRSRVPWMHRGELGLFRAWWRTCWMALRRPGDLAHSLNAPLPFRDAQRFWLINVVLLSLIAIAYHHAADAGESAVPFASGRAHDEPMLRDWIMANFAGPHFAGSHLPGVLDAAIVAALFLATGIVSYAYQFAPVGRRKQDRAAAAGLYVSGAFIAALVATTIAGTPGTLVWVALSGQGIEVVWRGDVLLPLVGTVLGLTQIGGLAAIILTYRRICHAGLLRTGLFAILLLVLITFAIGLCALVIPWFAGVASVLTTAWRM